MESGSEQLPLKVCRHCSVASRTESEQCPSCGRSYARPRLQWRWWFAIPIVALAFAGGYFGLSQLVYDDDGNAVTPEEAQAIAPGTSRTEVEEQLGEPSDADVNARGLSCTTYDVEGESDQAWLFCFGDDKLVSSKPFDVAD
jgi:hypothetical protein